MEIFKSKMQCLYLLLICLQLFSGVHLRRTRMHCIEEQPKGTSLVSNPEQGMEIAETHIISDLEKDCLSGFNTDLRAALLDQYASKNLLYSPISLYTMLSLLLLGTDKGSTTENELQTTLHLSQQQRSSVAQLAKEIVSRQDTGDDYKLILANKLYHRNGLTVKTALKNLADDNFRAEVEEINFKNASKAAKKINKWVKKRTSNLIEKTVSASDIDPETAMIVINTVYMKAMWQYKFSSRETFSQNFTVYESNAAASAMPTTIPVPMMYTENDFRFGNFSDTLKADVLQLPFKDTNTSMFIVLPNDIDGLMEVEKRLLQTNFGDLQKQLQMQEVTVRLPRFQIETDIELVPTLRKLHIEKLFTSSAELGELLTSMSNNVGLSQIKQKAILKVNEGGIEAAATSFATLTPLSLAPRMIYFTCDHPFIFLIADEDLVYFTGHIVKPETSV